jgi:hypothetical protein
MRAIHRLRRNLADLAPVSLVHIAHQGDREGAPLLWTALASQFTRSIVGAHPCGRPAGRWSPCPGRLTSFSCCIPNVIR